MQKKRGTQIIVRYQRTVHLYTAVFLETGKGGNQHAVTRRKEKNDGKKKLGKLRKYCHITDVTMQ
jgi:hypothetical protein